MVQDNQHGVLGRGWGRVRERKQKGSIMARACVGEGGGGEVAVPMKCPRVWIERILGGGEVGDPVRVAVLCAVVPR
jgi:hypothetical protein